MPMTTVIQFPEKSDLPLKLVVSEEVLALMGRYKVRQKHLADWLDLSQSGVSNRLNGSVQWTVDEIERVADAFDVHPAALMGGYATTPAPGGPGRGLPPILYAIRDSNPEPADWKDSPLTWGDALPIAS